MIRINTSTRVRDMGMNRIMRAMDDLKRIDVRVGVQSGERTEDGKFDLASVAAVQEFGSPARKIPSRPFMRESFDTKAKAIAIFGGQAAGKVVDGAIPARMAADLIGLKMTGFIQAKIVSGSWTPNTKYTIRRKKSNKPLIDTGRLRQSIRHVLVVK